MYNMTPEAALKHWFDYYTEVKEELWQKHLNDEITFEEYTMQEKPLFEAIVSLQLVAKYSNIELEKGE